MDVVRTFITISSWLQACYGFSYTVIAFINKVTLPMLLSLYCEHLWQPELYIYDDFSKSFTWQFEMSIKKFLWNQRVFFHNFFFKLKVDMSSRKNRHLKNFGISLHIYFNFFLIFPFLPLNTNLKPQKRVSKSFSRTSGNFFIIFF